MGAVFGFSNVAVYSSFFIILSSMDRAILSPPRCCVVEGGIPSSSSVGTEKSPFGPAMLVYDLSSSLRCEALISGSCFGGSCVKFKLKSPGSGIELGAGIGFAVSPSFLPACKKFSQYSQICR